MDVAMSSVAGQSEYQGKTYYFCSFGCKEAFDKEPNTYIEDGLEEPIYLVKNDIFLKV
jgi:Cu+-exporting ATPase